MAKDEILVILYTYQVIALAVAYGNAQLLSIVLRYEKVVVIPIGWR